MELSDRFFTPRGAKRADMDPFALSEPRRQLMQQAEGSGRKLRVTVRGTSEGPFKHALESIADQLEHWLGEAWEVGIGVVDTASYQREVDNVVRLEALHPAAEETRST